MQRGNLPCACRAGAVPCVSTVRILPRTHLVDSEADETEQRQEAADAQHQEPAIPLRQGHAAASPGTRRALPAPLNITPFAATPRYVPYGVLTTTLACSRIMKSVTVWPNKASPSRPSRSLYTWVRRLRHVLCTRAPYTRTRICAPRHTGDRACVVRKHGKVSKAGRVR